MACAMRQLLPERRMPISTSILPGSPAGETSRRVAAGSGRSRKSPIKLEASASIKQCLLKRDNYSSKYLSLGDTFGMSVLDLWMRKR